MSILIQGMDMPIIEMEWTIRHGADGKWYAIDTNAETSDGEWHEIILVPPHGDLIDRGETLKKIRPWSQEDEYAACTFDTVKKLMYTLLNDSPTIIPADPTEEGEP